MELSSFRREVLVLIYTVLSLVECQFLPPFNTAASLDVTPVSLIFIEGNTATLPCQVQNQEDMDVSWFTSNFDIIANGNKTVFGDSRMRVETEKPGDWNLVIENVQDSDTGVYICMLQSFPPQQKEITVYVKSKPVIDKDSLMERYLYKKGESLSITCKVSGYPEPSVKWYLFKTDMSTMDEIKELVSDTPVLMFTKLDESDGGIYRCEAKNDQGIAIYEIFLQEVYEPKLSTTKDKYTVKETSVIVLQCEIESNPIANIGWQRDGKLIKPDTRSDYPKYSIETYMEGDFKTVTELRIRDIDFRDRGDYQCLARNSIGRNYIKFNVIVKLSTTTVKYTTRKPTTAKLTTKSEPTQTSTLTSTSAATTIKQSDNLKKTTTAINYVEGPKTGDSRSHASCIIYSYKLFVTVFSIALLVVL